MISLKLFAFSLLAHSAAADLRSIHLENSLRGGEVCETVNSEEECVNTLINGTELCIWGKGGVNGCTATRPDEICSGKYNPTDADAEDACENRCEPDEPNQQYIFSGLLDGELVNMECQFAFDACHWCLEGICSGCSTGEDGNGED